VLIELPEHVGCQSDTANVFRNTRSIQAGWFARWFTNGNCYHVEHHWHAGIQVEHWRDVHRMLRNDVEFLETSYWSFYKRFIRALRVGAVNDPVYWQTQHTPSNDASTAVEKEAVTPR
jgi:fatty acid desaturase